MPVRSLGKRVGNRVKRQRFVPTPTSAELICSSVYFQGVSCLQEVKRLSEPAGRARSRAALRYRRQKAEGNLSKRSDCILTRLSLLISHTEPEFTIYYSSPA